MWISLNTKTRLRGLALFCSTDHSTWETNLKFIPFKVVLSWKQYSCDVITGKVYSLASRIFCHLVFSIYTDVGVMAQDFTVQGQSGARIRFLSRGFRGVDAWLMYSEQLLLYSTHWNPQNSKLQAHLSHQSSQVRGNKRSSFSRTLRTDHHSHEFLETFGIQNCND